jgi:putative hydrolase of HD superfamily
VIKKAFLTELFRAADMRRWNDKIRHIELRELDYQAHKMAIAYVLGRYEERTNCGDVDWIALIERGIFEFLERLVVTDITPQVQRRIEDDEDAYRRLRGMVFEHFDVMLPDFGGFEDRFKRYLSVNKKDANIDTSARIIDAASFCATRWEWYRIKQPNQEDYEFKDIEKRLDQEWRNFDDLQGISAYEHGVSPYAQEQTPYDQIKGFVDLCGNLRFQERWSHLHRVPRTSVLGHMLIVAILSYFFSLKIEETLKTEECTKRRFNNFFGGLFHDLPEALTRDIISPVKERGGIGEIIKEFEQEQMTRRIYKAKLIPKECFAEMRKFTEDEFQSKVVIDGKLETKTSDEINQKYAQNVFDPIDGQIIEAADHLAAFLEAYLAIQNGIVTSEFDRAVCTFKERYEKARPIAGLHFKEIYTDF